MNFMRFSSNSLPIHCNVRGSRETTKSWHVLAYRCDIVLSYTCNLRAFHCATIAKTKTTTPTTELNELRALVDLCDNLVGLCASYSLRSALRCIQVLSIPANHTLRLIKYLNGWNVWFQRKWNFPCFGIRWNTKNFNWDKHISSRSIWASE